MKSDEKRILLVERALTRAKKNQYSQEADKRTRIESGYGDCSGTMWYWYKKLFGIDIGGNTEAQINSSAGKRVDLKITNGIPEENRLKKGDLLYFRGGDNSRTEGVGHVEMYIGNGQIFGHGSGMGGTVKNLNSYCRQRQSQKSTAKLKNKGLICVKRFIPDDVIAELTETNDIVWELSHRGIVSDVSLWLEAAGRDKNVYWLMRKAVQYIRINEGDKEKSVKELEKNADNVWELAHRGIITNSVLWRLKGLEDNNVYWLMRKLVRFVRNKDI